jgi:hypothetical protein
MVCTIFFLKTKLRAVSGQTDGATPLYAASEKGHVGVVKALVKAKAALDQAKVCDRMPSLLLVECGVRACLWGDALERTSCEQWRERSVRMHVRVSVAWVRRTDRPHCASPASRVTLGW